MKKIDFNQIINKIYFFIASSEEKTRELMWRIAKSCVVVLSSYLLASTITTFFLPLLTAPTLPLGKQTKAAGSASVTIERARPLNHRDLRKVVMSRNIFNSGGEFPDESSVDQVGSGNVFNKNAACVKTSLNIDLLGLIYMERGKSLATIQEKGVEYADIYREGESLVGVERAFIYAIEQHHVVLNNNGTKECLELENIDKSVAKKFSTGAPAAAKSLSAALEDSSSGARESNSYTLTPDYVEGALGPGFGKILEAGRLVPFSREGQMVGFKLINVESESLFRKIGLNNSDVITRVNEISMAQPDQGFALYQALQDSREIRIEYLKGGNQPTIVTVDIK